MDALGKTRAEVLDLADTVCNGTAREAEVRRLTELLRDDLGHVQTYVEHLDLHAELYEAADRQSAEEVAVATFGRACGRKRRIRRRAMLVAMATAAATAVAACVVLAVGVRLTRPAAAVGRVVAVAAGTTFEGEAVEVDRVVRKGDRFRLESGFVTVELGPDVSVDLVGPVSTRVDSGQSFWLSRGLLAATVGPAGHGFTVKTEDSVVVDLGTRFQVRKDFTHGTQVRVTEGRIQATLRDEYGEDAKIVDLVAGETARLDASTSIVDRLDALFDFGAAYDPIAEAKGEARRFAGAAKPLSGPVVGLDFRRGMFLTSGYVYVVPERRGVTLAEPLGVAGETLPAGTTLDSYLLHCDTGEGFDFEEIGEGSVTFGRPVRALVTDAAGLVATDTLFATAGSRFEATPFRGLEAGSDEADVSGAGDVVTFDLSVEAGRAIDQFRVLVPTNPLPF